jgi:hypothetical protein
VSEIIANLLILAMTVSLFSGIFFYVNSMPPPKQEVYSDFSATTAFHPPSCVINVTKKGGQVLQDFRTRIYIFENGALYKTLNMSNGGMGNTWNTGKSWVYNVTTGVTSSTSLSISIIDYVANSVVWSSNLVGGQGGFPPIIGDRGTEPSPSYAGDKIEFYANVMDPDGNLRSNSVFVNATPIGLGFIKLTDSNNDGVFVSGQYAAVISWNGQILLVNATDQTNKKTTERMTLNIQLKPGGGTGGNISLTQYASYFVNGTYPPDASGGESGSQSGAGGTSFYYVRRLSDYAITRNFNPGEKVLIEVYSTALSNLALQNTFILYQPITGVPLTPQTNYTAFQYGGIYSTFYRYTYNFSAPSDSYIYPFDIKIKDNAGRVVVVSDTISVGGGSYPKLLTYKLVSGAFVQTGNFNHTDTIYLRIVTKDTDTYASTVFVSSIEVMDYTGTYIINKVPPSYVTPKPSNPPKYNMSYSAPLSMLYKTSGTSPTPILTSGGVYTLYIVPKDAYQGWWLPKKNAYTLKIPTISDTGSGPNTAEVYSQLDCQINITAPPTTADVVATLGSGSFTWSASGASWSNSEVGWFKGGSQWSETVIDSNPSQGPIALALGDLNGDGRNDVVVGSQSSQYSNLFYYLNLKPDGSAWSSAFPIAMPFKALTGTNAHDGSTDQYSNYNADATVWATSGGGSDHYVVNYNGETFATSNDMVGAIAIGDFDHDGKADVVASFIHIVAYTTATSESSADSSNTWGCFFNRGIYVFWNDGNWTRTTLYSTTSWIASNKANDNSNPAAMDVAVGDFNRDGYPDIVAVYENGTTKVWLNQYGNTAGDANARERGAFTTSNSLRALPALPSADSSKPWDHIEISPRVKVADMNLDGYPDIIRTSTVGKCVSIYYTQPGSPDEVDSSPTAEYAFNPSNTAARVGSMTNLAAADKKYENLTEVVYQNYPITNTTPADKSGNDNTGQNIANLQTNNSVAYNVTAGTTMWIADHYVDSTYSGKMASYVKLIMRYYVDSGYSGTSYVQWAFTPSGPFISTTIRPTSSNTSYVQAQYVFPWNVNTYDLVKNLQIKFVNTGGATVHFDYMIMQVKFVQTWQMGWVWQIPNANKAFHNLTFVGHRSGTNPAENFRLAYSVDNTTWFNLTDIVATSDKTFTYLLPYTPSSSYWIRVEDLIRDPTDTVNDTLFVDQLVIRHYALSVTWVSAIKIPWSGVPGYITAIAVGDMGKSTGDYKPDGWLDIVVGTAAVGGSGNQLNSLFIMTQTSVGSFDVKPVFTLQLSQMCSDPSKYDVTAVDVGDMNGDGSPDIILVVGAPAGVSPGSGPTLWYYESQNQFSTGGGYWQYSESYVGALTTTGTSAINVKTGNVDLAIFFPLLGVMGVIVADALVRKKR